jgi:hypothetical protein
MIKSRRIRWVGHVACMEGRRMQIGFCWESQKERCRWEDNIKMGLREIGWGDMYWIHLAWDRDQ